MSGPYLELPGALEGLMPAFDRSRNLDISEWMDRCKADQAQIWFKDGFWLMTQVQPTKEGRALHIIAAAGNYNHDLIAEAEDWGRSQGCASVFYTGRPGWIRREPGYTLKTVTMQKDLA